MVDILNTDVSFISIEASITEQLYMGIGLGILISSVLLFVYLSSKNQDDYNHLICRLWQ